jgi:hypothetical protein
MPQGQGQSRIDSLSMPRGMHAECHIILKREALFFVGKECLGTEGHRLKEMSFTVFLVISQVVANINYPSSLKKNVSSLDETTKPLVLFILV